MSLLFQTRGGTFEQRWIYYAMLRDNVQHHLEGGAPGEAFSALHAVARVLSAGRVAVPAAKLRGELARVRDEVLALPMSEFAVSLRTNAVISVAWPLPERRDTVLIRDASSTHIPIDPGMKTLGDAFGHMVESLLRLTEGAADDDAVEVLDV